MRKSYEAFIRFWNSHFATPKTSKIIRELSDVLNFSGIPVLKIDAGEKSHASSCIHIENKTGLSFGYLVERIKKFYRERNFRVEQRNSIILAKHSLFHSYFTSIIPTNTGYAIFVNVNYPMI